MPKPTATVTKLRQTTDSRKAIAAFVDGNFARVQALFDGLADGVMSKLTPGAYITKPEPEKAIRLYLDFLEFHVPKLARTELTGEDGGPVVTRELSDLETVDRLLAMLESARSNG